ncbi:RHS repeat-associated core domain-containing protein [Allorhizocola rhizosphaerae]|uniref:RHS repeat-associated core domain-containing protein n=1 Tax=Allorhizocola rhizosphaerae TaxID=1872709 RepID=UPI000E3EB0A2|nr:RHS repeat-associated core domain-containing protein [Allorhizocola rhizosphaerae]
MRTFLAVVLVVLMVGVLRTPEPAAAAGPSTELERIDPVPVTQQVMGGRGPDQATSSALSGNQPPGSAPKEGGGTPGASPLSPSASWQVSGHTGDFTWSYPLRVPPSPGGLEPQLALSYSSSTVDGRTSATNNQASWVGDGWDLSAGFVERIYGACATDGHPDSGDLCWRTDNAVVSFPGGGGQLIREAGRIWRLEADNGARIEQRTGVVNGDDDGEHWEITTVDGTRYFFGSRPESQSTWTVPVVGDDAGEPCHQTGRCVQAWRWNLDRVVDTHGNELTYRYEAETHTYGANLTYVRGGTLRAIDYAGGRVDFVTADRCVPGSECTQARKENWPDVPWDGDKSAPSFWTGKRLAKVTTTARNDGVEKLVESWTLEHLFPNPGDGGKPALWLRSITRTGHVGGEVALPPVVFEGQRLGNRVHLDDAYARLNRYRINAIVTETGGVIDIRYRAPDCTPTSLPAAAQGNTKLCYPVKWKPKDSPERADWFIKYVVEAVSEHDRMGSTLAHTTSYEYLDGAAWQLDTGEFTEQSKRTWSEYRGFARVRVRKGTLPDPSGLVGMTEYRYHRGMDGDTGPDFTWLAGFQHYTAVHLGETETVVSKSVSTPTWQGPFATRGALKSYLVRTGQTQTSNDVRQTRKVSTFDDRGLVTSVDDLGDIATPDDDRCTRTTYARNTAAWILDRASRTEVFAVSCVTTPALPRDGLADVQTAYDGQDFGLPPSKGDPTRVKSAKEWGVYQDTMTTQFDSLGRPTKTIDALGRVTTTAYTPTTVSTTNALGHTVTTTLEPAWGLPTKSVDANTHLTETAYDPLGRVKEVWLPNRPRTKFPAAGSERYAYLVRNDAPTVVSTTTLGPTGNYVTSNVLYDGLLRMRQTQEPAPGGGRLIVDTRYDTHGRAYLTTSPFYSDGAVDDKLWLAHDTNVPALTVNRYDGAERVTVTEFRVHDHMTKRTTVVYGADRVHVTPPPGAPPTTTVTDARGRTVELIEAGKSTRYTYSKSGQLASITDPAGNTWRYEYDLLGRQTRAEDVDKGVAVSTYDAAGQLTTVTDARGSTLSHEYDALGRKTRVKRGTDTLAEWTYDTVTNGIGMPARSTRYQEGKAYITEISGYSTLKQPTRTKVTIPDIDTSFTTYFTYNTDGSRKEELLPPVGDLPAESITHTYDDAGRPIKTYGGFPGKTVWYVSNTEYTRYGEATRLHLGEGTTRAWLTGYHQLGTRWPERMVVDAEAPAPKVSDSTLRYDEAGNITSIEETDERQCFRYDPHRRLTQAWTPVGDCSTQPLGGPAPYRQAFTYDDAGNRTSDLTRQYTYTRGHRLDGHEYDAAGNTVSRPGQRLEWDAEGHLSKVVSEAGETSFVYTADGDRLMRKDPSGTTIYLAGQELRIDRATGVRKATRYYTHAGAVVAVRADGRLTWLAGDHQNTAQVAIDAETLAVQRRRFDPFGNPRGDQGAFPSDKGFLGGTADASTGLTHLGAREYDPALGRFISVDPILAPDDPQQLNGYGYANNSPVTYSDPSGLFRASCPDGECRFGGWAKNKSPASTWGNTKPFQHRCADAAKRCRAAEPTTTKMSSGMVVRRSVYGITVNRLAIPHMRDSTALIEGMNRFAGDGYFERNSDIGHRDSLWALIGACETYAKDACSNELYMWAHEMQQPNIDRELKILGQVFAPGVRGMPAVRGGVSTPKTGGGTTAGSAKPCHSFDGSTPVRMADGTDKPIRDVELGDEVLATDPETGRTEAREVVLLHRNRDYDLVDLTVRTAGGETTTLKTTATHPFWVNSRESWVDAAEVRVGDLLHGLGGGLVEVVGAQSFAGDKIMHDLTVEGIHTYYVVATRTPVLVHNNNGFCEKHPIPGWTDPRYKGPCTCPAGSQMKGAPERHPGEGVPSQPQTVLGASARSAKLIDDALEAGGDPTVGIVVGSVAAAGGIARGVRGIGRWWRAR